MLGARRRRAGFHVRATRPQQCGGGPAATATTTVPTPPATPIRRVRRGQHPASVGSADGANATPSTCPCASSRLARRRRPHPGRDLQGRGTLWFPERQRGPGQPPVSEVDRAAGPGGAGEVEVVALPGDRGSRAQVVADDADDGVADLSKAAEGGTGVLAEVFALGRSVAGIGVVGQAQERAQYVDAGLAEVAGAGVVGEPGQGVDAAELDCGGEVAELGDGAVNRSVRCPCSVSSCVRRCPSYAASTPSMAAWAERRIALPVHRITVRGRPAAWRLGAGRCTSCGILPCRIQRLPPATALAKSCHQRMASLGAYVRLGLPLASPPPPIPPSARLPPQRLPFAWAATSAPGNGS